MPSKSQSSPNPARPTNREVENENLRPSRREGEPPRPATEPPRTKKQPIPRDVLNDPGSGKPVR